MPTASRAGGPDRRVRDERGSALLVTMMVMALVTALATTVGVFAINNLQSSWRAQQAGSAVNAADAGVAQAVAYLRGNGVRGLGCSPTCTTNPWGNQQSPARVDVPGKAGQAYTAWIQPVAPYPANDPGLYRVHATGTASGSASRSVVADVQVTSTEVPLGIVARSISGGGAASVSRQSIVSTGCVYNRSRIVTEGIDAAHGIPAAVHSSQVITESSGTGQYCPSANKPIHREPPKFQTSRPCNTAYPYDQDSLGGSLVDTSCWDPRMGTEWAEHYAPRDLDGDSSPDVNGSFVKDDATLLELFGLRSPALSQTQLDRLRTVAHAQGNYWTGSTGWTSPDESQAVMFFDLAATDPGGVVDLNDVTGFSRAAALTASDPTCETRSLVIVIEGGNVRLNSNQQLAAALFLTSEAPHGQVFKANGTSSFIGSIYADTVNLVGTTNASLDECFLANRSPALLDIAVRSYRELDR